MRYLNIFGFFFVPIIGIFMVYRSSKTFPPELFNFIFNLSLGISLPIAFFVIFRVIYFVFFKHYEED